MHSSTEWLQHFQRNAGRLLAIPWERGAELTGREARAIAGSVAEFQRGESGEGRRLSRYAEAYARATGDHDYPMAIRLFVSEEQRHARDLARFLALNHLPLAPSTAGGFTFGTYWSAAWRCFSDAFAVSQSVRRPRRVPSRRPARLKEADEASRVG